MRWLLREVAQFWAAVMLSAGMVLAGPGFQLLPRGILVEVARLAGAGAAAPLQGDLNRYLCIARPAH